MNITKQRKGMTNREIVDTWAQSDKERIVEILQYESLPLIRTAAQKSSGTQADEYWQVVREIRNLIAFSNIKE